MRCSQTKLALIVACLPLSYSLGVCADTTSLANNPTNVNAIPISIEADHFKVSLVDEKAIWRGDVKATQGNYTFHASVLTVHLDQVTQTNTQNSEDGQTENVADHSQVSLSAKNVSYDLGGDKIVAQGNSELRRGVELIKAEHITYHVSEQTAYARPDAQGRVHVQFFSNPQQPVFPSVASLQPNMSTVKAISATTSADGQKRSNRKLNNRSSGANISGG